MMQTDHAQVTQGQELKMPETKNKVHQTPL
jgi:hypothetical protein